jgi:hypothetical protein
MKSLFEVIGQDLLFLIKSSIISDNQAQVKLLFLQKNSSSQTLQFCFLIIRIFSSKSKINHILINLFHVTINILGKTV